MCVFSGANGCITRFDANRSSFRQIAFLPFIEAYPPATHLGIIVETQNLASPKQVLRNIYMHVICRWKHASVARERQICAMCRDGGVSSLISCHCTGDAKFCVSTGWRGNYVRTVCAHYFCSSPYYIYYLTLLYILSHLIIYMIPRTSSVPFHVLSRHLPSLIFAIP